MVERAPLMEKDELVRRYKEFILYFVDDEGEPVYKAELVKMVEEQRRSISVDWNHLYSYGPDYRELAEDLLVRPSLHMEAGGMALRELVSEMIGDVSEERLRIYREEEFRLRFHNLPTKASIRDLIKFSVGRIVETDGIITRVSDVHDKLVKAAFVCTNEIRGHIEEIDLRKVRFRPPEKCPECGSPMRFDVENSRFVMWRSVRIQERPEDLPPGALPSYVEGILLDDLVNEVKAGDRVKITGIIKLKQVRGEGKTPEGPLFKRYLEIVHVEVPNRVYEKLEITPEDEEEIRKLAARPDVEELVVKSIAPSIVGWYDIKRAIAYALFGGVGRVLPDGTKVRGEINLLLVGDPGVSKSQLLKYVAGISPRGLYTTGKGSTAAGLTAAVVRDSTTGGWTLEAGALVLADRGVACIDEFDKMNEDDRRAIHEAMEQQTISIAKAGIVATLNARTTIIAAANPKRGRYDRYLSPLDNIDLPPTILSRFDLVFIMVDAPDPHKDDMVASHILSARMGHNPEVVPPIPPDLLKKYIAYARQNINPVLSREAAERIRKFYVELRGHGGVSETEDYTVQEEYRGIPLTPRQLEALIRLSEARARLHLRDFVTEEDADIAIKLVDKMIKDVVYDVTTQSIEIAGFMTGTHPIRERMKSTIRKRLLEMLQEAEDRTVERSEVISTLAKELNMVEKAYHLEKMLDEVLVELRKEGVIYFPPGERFRDKIKLVEDRS